LFEYELMVVAGLTLLLLGLFPPSDAIIRTVDFYQKKRYTTKDELNIHAGPKNFWAVDSAKT